MTYDVVVIVGSLRKESWNRKLAHALIRLAPVSLKLEEVAIGDLPLYNADLEDAIPPSWIDLRARIKRADAILFVTPEYNRSVPAALKNALDICSRPPGSNVWDGKPGAVITSTPGAMGGFGANHHLRQSLVFLNIPTMQQPEAYIGHVDKIFDETGSLTNEGTEKYLNTIIAAFSKWVSIIVGVKSNVQ
jgi:chromate reductase